MINGKRIVRTIRRGMDEVQRIYRQQRRAAEARATRRLEVAKTRAEQARIKSELELELLILKRRMYEAKAKVIREREAVDQAKREAGVLSPVERASGFIHRTMGSVRKLGDELYGPAPKRRTARRKVARSSSRR